MTRLNLALSTVVAAFLIGGAGSASAGTVCLNGSSGSHNYGPDPSCSTTETELAIKLNGSSGSASGSGDINTTTVVDFHSSDPLKFASGNGTITGTFGSLDMTVPHNTFDDFLFTLQFVKTGAGSSDVENLTVTTNGYFHTYNDLEADTDIKFILVSSTPLSFVNLSSDTGIKEAKNFEISSVGAGVVPELSSWAMMFLGFAALGFAGYRGAQHRAALAA
jgi:hypothetical protein